MLTIVGGTYLEYCTDPFYRGLYGSGFRGALALSGIIPSIRFSTCLGENEVEDFLARCAAYGIVPTIIPTTATISFNYEHPLKKPIIYPDVDTQDEIRFSPLACDYILYYGMAETTPSVVGKKVVYDPQSLIKFSDTNSHADCLAIILNRKEANRFSGLGEQADLIDIGNELRMTEGAEIVVIKNGSDGAWVFDTTGISKIPVFETPTVWPIGSGDIFSAVFAWKWMCEGRSAKDAAYFASRYTAGYCASSQLQLPKKPRSYPALKHRLGKQKVYLAGPFFTMAERWLINELKNALEDFGNQVFSPFHDVRFSSDKEIAQKDLKGLNACDAVLAVVAGLDAGTLFEIGYARAKKKRVVVLSENVSDEDLLMLTGSGCEITHDLSTAIYKVSW
jgi:hypothetical protein